ncbi:MAG: NADH-quinone oxidoreductase subunit L, partial [Candidatus Omnitrophica bacterium]|nr:NADH-quinone oxidoreductase subunit L [Candidatus Omnitrophota bacterium]
MNLMFVLLPFFGVVVLNLPFRTIMKKAAFWVTLMVTSAQVVLALFPAKYPLMSASIDSVSRIMLLSIGIVLISTLFVQKYIVRDEEKLFNLRSLLLLVLAGMNGVVLVKDI